MQPIPIVYDILHYSAFQHTMLTLHSAAFQCTMYNVPQSHKLGFSTLQTFSNTQAQHAILTASLATWQTSGASKVNGRALTIQSSLFDLPLFNGPSGSPSLQVVSLIVRV